MADLSAITTPDGTTYNIKDSTARSELSTKQDTLVSGSNIKTINNQSLLGSGNIDVQGGSGSVNDVRMNGASVVTSGTAYITDSSGNMTIDGVLTSGGKIISGGRFVLPYNTYFVAKDSDGTTERPMFFFYNGVEYFGNNSYDTTIRGSSISLATKISNFYKITNVSISVNGINAHNYISGSSHTMTAQTGYEAVGIVGWETSNYRIRPTSHYISSNTSLFSGFANTSASNVTSTTTMIFRVLWLKATSG